MQLFFSCFSPCETNGGKLREYHLWYSLSSLPKFASISSKIEVFMTKTLVQNMSSNSLMKNLFSSHADTFLRCRSMDQLQLLLVQVRDRLDCHMASSSTTRNCQPGMITLSNLMELPLEGDATTLKRSDPQFTM